MSITIDIGRLHPDHPDRQTMDGMDVLAEFVQDNVPVLMNVSPSITEDMAKELLATIATRVKARSVDDTLTIKVD